MRMGLRLLWDAGTGEGGASGGGTTPPPPPPPAADPTKAFKEALAAMDSETASLARRIFDDNEKLKGELAELRKKVPGEGAVVLAGDLAKAWEGYQALGKPEEIQALKTERDELSAYKAGVIREREVAKAAQALGYDAEVLAGLPGFAELKVVFKPVKGKDGKEIETPHLAWTDAEGKEQEQTLEAAVAARWAKFAPALKATPAPARATAVGSPPARLDPSRIPGASGTPANSEKSILSKRYNAVI